MTTRQVTGPHGTFVIRTDPHGMPFRIMSYGSSVYVLRLAFRRLRGDRSFDVRVRSIEHDPFGPDEYVELAADRVEANATIERLTNEIRSGRLGT